MLWFFLLNLCSLECLCGLGLKASACIYSFHLIDRRVVSSLLNMHVSVSGFLLSHPLSHQTRKMPSRLSLVENKYKIFTSYAISLLYKKSATKIPFPHLGKGKLVRIIGRFQTSTVKLQRLPGEGQLSLARIIGNFEKTRIREMGIPLYLSVQTLVELAQKLFVRLFLVFRPF